MGNAWRDDEFWMREAIQEAHHCLRPHRSELQFTSAETSQNPSASHTPYPVNRQSSIVNRQSDVPVGAVCVFDNQIISRGHNRRELDGDPTAHAEMLALRAAAAHLQHWRLTGVTLYVTLEPCLMCAGAIWLARVERVVFGAWDERAGACGSLFDITRDPRLNHRPQLRGGVLAEDCAALLKDFFAMQRKSSDSE